MGHPNWDGCDNELFSKLKLAEVDPGVAARIESLTDPHSPALIGGSGTKSNANLSSRMYSLSSLMSLPNEDFDMVGDDELILFTRRFERMNKNRLNTRRNSQTCFQCGKPGHFFADCLEKMENKDNCKH
jgi:hypothetical protein